MAKERFVRSVNGVEIRLTKERWRHIASRHPELEPFQVEVLKTVKLPDFVVKGRVGDLIAVKRYAAVPLRSKYLIVAYREINRTDGFIITAHFISDVKALLKRGALWRKKS